MTIELPFVSERFGNRWTACTECAAVMAAHHARPSIPVNTAEVVALRKIGPHAANGGTTAAAIAHEVFERYGHNGEQATSLSDLQAALNAGAVATIAVNFARLPGQLQRYQPSLAASPAPWHSIVVGPAATGGTLAGLYFLRDPLGPLGYTGEWSPFGSWAPAILAPFSQSAIIYRPNSWGDAPTPAEPTKDYTVQGGDSLSRIATLYGVDLAWIIANNRDRYPGIVANPRLIRAGWVLRVPV
jgi:hypothetical protein